MTRKAYISYSRNPQPLVDLPFIKKLKAENVKTANNWTVEYDEKAVSPGDYIPGFEEQLSQGNQVIFLLSAEYFKSVHCVKELLMTYESQAGKLLPIVVFATGYNTKDLDVGEILEYWGEKKRNEKNPEFSKILPFAVAWMLGKYNADHQYWETYFTVCDASADGAIDEIICCLDKKRSPRFKHIPTESKERKIKKGIEEIIKAPVFDPVKVEFKDFLSSSKKADDVKEILKVFVQWLNELEDKNYSGLEHKALATSIKQLTGLLVLTALDNTYLHRTIHWLNRMDDRACLEISKAKTSSFQLIVSAITNAPVLFNYYPRSEYEKKHKNHVPLVGEGELVLHERGAVNKNYIKSIKQETKWLKGYQALADQMAVIEGAEPEGDLPDITNASETMKGFLEDRSDYYLLLDQENISAASSLSFRTDLNKNIPGLPQVFISNEDKNSANEDKNSVDKFFIEKLSSAYINQKIHTIYGHIYRLRNAK